MALELSDLKRTITNPGNMACHIIRLCLGEKLIGMSAKRGKAIPENYYHAVYSKYTYILQINYTLIQPYFFYIRKYKLLIYSCSRFLYSTFQAQRSNPERV